MFPAQRADQIFPASCEEYTAHLGQHQAEAFKLLWTIHDAPDRLTNGDGAAWNIHRALKTGEGIRVAPLQVQTELFEALRTVEANYGKGATAGDIEYAGLFVAIAGWQHEILAGNIDAFVETL